MKIAICASEAVPFAKTGGLADVAGALPLALETLNQEVIIIIPGYKAIKQSKFKIQPLDKLKDYRPRINSTGIVMKEGISYSILGNNIKVYFIENDVYFNRDGLYVDKTGSDYKDNLDRFSYYSRAALELLKAINFKPDMIHVHDWQASLIPVYLKTLYKDNPFYKNTKTILTIHNIGYQGLFPRDEFPKLGLDWGVFNMEMLEFYDKVNILKGGIIFSDIINTVSQTYSKEIQTKEFGYGLEGVLAKRKEDLFGILNGLDYSIWNPEFDRFIASSFSAKNLEGKYRNKVDLQEICKLPAKKDVPLFGIVSRLAEQKGFDILSAVIDKICKMNLQLVILGTGDLKYHLVLQSIAKKYPQVISLHLKFDDQLAHKIYAGSDIFVMPSKYEPCGLGQMISFRYGTIPLVFKTGGLADTVTEDNGFVFDSYKKEVLVKTIGGAVRAFKNNKKWSQMMQRAMQCNFSWEESARQYLDLYVKAHFK